MNPLPDGWQYANLGDVITPSKERFNPVDNENRPFIGLAHIESGTGSIIGQGNSSDTKSLKSVFTTGDILYGRLRPYLNKVTVPQFGGVCSTDILVFPKRKLLSSKYISFFLLTPPFVQYATQNMSGVQHPRVKFDTLAEFLIPVAPFNEQFRIVGRIEELLSQLDAGVRSLLAAQTQLEQYRQTTLKRAYTGKLTEKWRHENPDNESSSPLIDNIKRELGKLPPQRFTPKKIKLDNLSELPDKWSWVQMGEVFYIILGQSPPSSTYNEVNKGLPFFQGSKEFTERYPIIQKWCSVPKKIAEKNDVLISVRAPVGDVNIAPEQCCIGRGLSAIRALAGVKPLYVYHIIEFIRSDLKSKGTGSTFNAITGDVLRSQIIPLPPLDEIDEIVENIEMSFSIFKRIEKNLDQNIRKCERMKQSILKKAFEGRLVPQDPNDEPASLLLERIKAQIVKQGKLT